MMNKKFGQNLKRLRLERSLSQQKLARLVEVSQQCISEWEHDNIEPTMSSLWKLADAFDISIDELIGRDHI